MQQGSTTAVVRHEQKEQSLNEWITTAGAQARISTLDADLPIAQVLSNVFVMLGIPKSNVPGPEESRILISYVKDQLGRYSLMDIKIAITMYIQCRLDEQPKKEHLSFSPFLMERIMQSYSRFRFNRINKPADEEQSDVPPLTPDEFESKALSFAINAFERVRQGQEVNDWGNLIYRWLDRKGLIPFTRQEKEAILEEARLKMDHQVHLGIKFPPGDSRENHAKMLAKEIALKQYFEGLILNGVDIRDELKRLIDVSDNADRSVPRTKNTGEKADQRDQKGPGSLPEEHPGQEAQTVQEQ